MSAHRLVVLNWGPNAEKRTTKLAVTLRCKTANDRVVTAFSKLQQKIESYSTSTSNLQSSDRTHTWGHKRTRGYVLELQLIKRDLGVLSLFKASSCIHPCTQQVSHGVQSKLPNWRARLCDPSPSATMQTAKAAAYNYRLQTWSDAHPMQPSIPVGKLVAEQSVPRKEKDELRPDKSGGFFAEFLFNLRRFVPIRSRGRMDATRCCCCTQDSPMQRALLKKASTLSVPLFKDGLSE